MACPEQAPWDLEVRFPQPYSSSGVVGKAVEGLGGGVSTSVWPIASPARVLLQKRGASSEVRQHAFRSKVWREGHQHTYLSNRSSLGRGEEAGDHYRAIEEEASIVAKVGQKFVHGFVSCL